jgi:hypothetical protein
MLWCKDKIVIACTCEFIKQEMLPVSARDYPLVAKCEVYPMMQSFRNVHTLQGFPMFVNEVLRR